jgi:hypothetical protein
MVEMTKAQWELCRTGVLPAPIADRYGFTSKTDVTLALLDGNVVVDGLQAFYEHVGVTTKDDVISFRKVWIVR